MLGLIVFRSSTNTVSEYGKIETIFPLILIEVVVPAGLTSYVIVGFL